MAGAVEIGFAGAGRGIVQRHISKRPARVISKVAVRTSAGSRIAGLDLLRLAAALAVLVFHYCFRGVAGQNLSQVAFPEIAGIAKYGFLGVDLFFMISGFVIAASAEGRTAWSFAVARAGRLYPAHVVCTTLTALAIALWGIAPHHAGFVQWLANLTMAAPVLGQRFMDGAYWSIMLELVFYGWVAVLIGLGLFERRLLDIVAIWLSLCLLNETVLHIKPLQLLALTEYGPMFASGVLMHRIWRGDSSRIVWALLAFAAVLASFHAYEVRSAFAQLYHEPMEVRVLWLLQAGLYGLFAGALMASRRITATPLVLALGGITYPLYLLHQNVGYISLGRLEPLIGRWPALVVVVAGVIAAAWLVWRFAEKPGRGLVMAVAHKLETLAR